MIKIRILDLFCGAGGAAKGYYDAFSQAGFDVDITGIDIKPQQNYPFRMLVGDAMTWRLDGYDFIHASPPCQDHSVASSVAKHNGTIYTTGWMLEATHKRLKNLSIPWVIENVSTAKMHNPVLLCGSMFGLKVYRHRLFDSNYFLYPAGVCSHPNYLLDGYVSVYGHAVIGRKHKGKYPSYPLEVGKSAMNIDWMNHAELSQSIPPAYTKWIGQQISAVLWNRAVAS